MPRLTNVGKWIAVDSSAIAEMKYDQPVQVLRVRFVNKLEYHYAFVPPNDFQKLIAAESIGHDFNVRIKSRYPSRRVA